MNQASSIQNLLEELERLPGIGPKSAQRIMYWLLTNEGGHSRRLAEAILEVKETISFCPVCYNFAEGGQCSICANEKRDHSMICVVEEPRDLTAIEKTQEFEGVYHVLGGVLSPMDGVGPENLKLRELMARLSDEEISEVVLATNPNVEGETTATYIARLIKPLGIKVTRLASGLPVGGDLEFADEVTLGRALEARREM